MLHRSRYINRDEEEHMPEKVKPGDLITADFMNGLIDMMNELQERVEALEESPRPEQPTPEEAPDITSVTDGNGEPDNLEVNEVAFINGEKLSSTTGITFIANQERYPVETFDAVDKEIKLIVPKMRAINPESGTPVTIEIRFENFDTITTQSRVRR
jgi:hypothetical protein